MLTLCLALGLHAFQDAKFIVQEQYRVDFVLLDIQAYRGRRDEAVTDLVASDFKIEENGRQMETGYFEILDFRGRKPAAARVAGQESVSQDPRQVILAVDLEAAEDEDVARTIAEMREFLEPLPERLPFHLNLYCMELGFLTKGFVTDRDTALLALDDYEALHAEYMELGPGFRGDRLVVKDRAPARSFSGKDEPPSPREIKENTLKNLGDLEDVLENCHNGWCIQKAFELFVAHQQYRSNRVILELEKLAYEFNDYKGLKLLLFVSPGFGLNQFNSAEELAKTYLNPYAFPSDRGQTGAIDFISNLNVKADFKSVVHACIKNRIVFHTFDIYNHKLDQGARGRPRLRRVSPAARVSANGPEFRKPIGLTLGDAYHSYPQEISSGLQSLAKESGGTFYQKNDLNPALQEVLDKSNFFYVLGYASPHGRPGQFREIKVDVGRRGVKLRYRTGYYGQ